MDYDPVTGLPWGANPFKVTSGETYQPFTALDTSSFPAFVMDPCITSTPFDSAASPAYSYPDYGTPSQRPSLAPLQKDSPAPPVAVPSLASSGSSDAPTVSMAGSLPTPGAGSKVEREGWFSQMQAQYLGGFGDQEGMPKKFDLATMLPPPEVLPPSNEAELELERLLMGTPGPLFSIASPPRHATHHPNAQLLTPMSHPSSLPVTPQTRRASLQPPTPTADLESPARRSITNPLPQTPQSSPRRPSPGLTIAIPPPLSAEGFLPTPTNVYNQPRTPSPHPSAASPAGPLTPEPTPARKVKPLPKRKPSTGVGISDASNLRRGSFSREGAWTRRRSSKANPAPAVPARQGSIQGQFHLGPTPMPQPHPEMLHLQPGPSAPPHSMGMPVAGIERSLLFAPTSHPEPAPLPTFAISEAPPPLPTAPLPMTTSADLLAHEHHGVMLGPDDYHLLSEMDPLSMGPSQQIPASAPAWQQSFAPHQIAHPLDQGHPGGLAYGDFYIPQGPLGRPMPPTMPEQPYAQMMMAPYMEQTRSAPMPQRQYSVVDHQGNVFQTAAPMPVLQSQMMHRRRGSSVDSATMQAPTVVYTGPFDGPMPGQQVFESLQMGPADPGMEMYAGPHGGSALLPPLPIYHPGMVRSAPPQNQCLPSVPMSYHAGSPPPSAAGRQIAPLPSSPRSGAATAHRRALGLAPPPLVPRGNQSRRRATAGPGVPTLSSFSNRSVSSHHLSPPAAGPSNVHRIVSTPSRLAAAKSATAKAGGKVSQGPGNSMFINFTSKDSKKLLKGVAPSGSSKRKREAEDDLALELARKDAGAKEDKRRVVTA